MIVKPEITRAPPRLRRCSSAEGVTKRRYTKADAKSALRQLRARGESGLNAYRCTLCDWWHLGHQQTERRAS